MKEPIVIACVPETGPHRHHVVQACLELQAEALFARPDRLGLAIPLAYHNKRPAVVVGLGQEGCVGVAKEIAASGLMGVAAVILVGPEAPWPGWPACEVCRGRPSAPFDADRCGVCVVSRGPADIGPLGTMRSVAHAAKEGSGLRFVLVCYPRTGTCEACEGTKTIREPGYLPRPCGRCKDVPRLLGADDMARELVGVAAVPPWPAMTDWSRRDVGGATTLCVLTKPFLRGEGTREALRIALKRGPREEKA